MTTVAISGIPLLLRATQLLIAKNNAEDLRPYKWYYNRFR